LLEGLEAIEINYSFLNSIIDFRIESEFFDKKFLLIDEILNKKKTISFAKIATAINGRPYCSDSFNAIKGIKLSKIGDVTNRRDIENWATVDSKEFDKQKGQFLTKGDILMTLTGDPPDVGKVNYIYNPINSSWNQRVAKIKIISDTVYINNESLFVVLSTKYSRTQLERFAKGIRQRNLGNESLEHLLLPILSNDFQIKLKKIILDKYELLEDSKQKYTKAENLLLEELDLQNFTPSKESINIKSFKGSFGTSGRLDAEYYQVKYDELEEKIKQTKQYVSIIDIRTDNYRGLQPKYDKNGELDIINSKHILETTLNYNKFEKTSLKYWDEQKRARVFKNDILTYTTGANIGRTQIYLIDKKALASNHVNILRLQDGYNSQYVSFVMNSFIGRLQTEKLSAGSAQAELYPKDIDKFLIPLIKEEKQQQIAKLIEQSFSLKKQSEHLLEVAKRAVEIAIEENEAVALKYIKQETT